MTIASVTNSQTTTQQQDKPVHFFQDDNGNYSSTRLMSFIALIAAILFAGYTISHESGAGIDITISFLVAAFCPKVVQKFAEKNNI